MREDDKRICSQNLRQFIRRRRLFLLGYFLPLVMGGSSHQQMLNHIEEHIGLDERGYLFDLIGLANRIDQFSSRECSNDIIRACPCP
jgi:hypothetical protein